MAVSITLLTMRTASLVTASGQSRSMPLCSASSVLPTVLWRASERLAAGSSSGGFCVRSAPVARHISAAPAATTPAYDLGRRSTPRASPAAAVAVRVLLRLAQQCAGRLGQLRIGDRFSRLARRRHCLRHGPDLRSCAFAGACVRAPRRRRRARLTVRPLSPASAAAGRGEPGLRTMTFGRGRVRLAVRRAPPFMRG